MHNSHHKSGGFNNHFPLSVNKDVRYWANGPRVSISINAILCPPRYRQNKFCHVTNANFTANTRLHTILSNATRGPGQYLRLDKSRSDVISTSRISTRPDSTSVSSSLSLAIRNMAHEKPVAKTRMLGLSEMRSHEKMPFP